MIPTGKELELLNEIDNCKDRVNQIMYKIEKIKNGADFQARLDLEIKNSRSAGRYYLNKEQVVQILEMEKEDAAKTLLKLEQKYIKKLQKN